MAAAYDSFDYENYWKGRDYEHQSELHALKEFLYKLKKLGIIADIGCGYGRITPSYINRARYVILTDPSASLLKTLRENLKLIKKQQSFTARTKIIQSSLENLPGKIKKNSIDLILMIRVLHHLKDPEKAFKITSQLIRPGGYLILEFPNKLHGKALLKNIFHGNVTYPLDIFPSDKRSPKNIKNRTLPFMNYHPDSILKYFKDNRFEVVSVRSVSNIRSSKMKKNIPLETLMTVEKLLQRPLAKFYFGPSIFILARKKIDK